jgi:hypothetical protein
MGYGQRWQRVLVLINPVVRHALYELQHVSIVNAIRMLMVLHKAFASQYGVHAVTSEPQTLFEKILQPIKDLVILWLFLTLTGGTVCPHYPGVPTLAHIKGFRGRLNGFALAVGFYET